MSARRIARVALDSPLPQLDRLFDYAIPASLAPDVREGVRVKVPLRTAGRVIEGFVVEIDDEPESDRALSEIEEVVSSVTVLPRRLYDLARRTADRSAGSVADILRLAVPRRMVRAERAWLARSSQDAADRDSTPARTGATQEWIASVLSAYPNLAPALDASQRLALGAPVGMSDDAHEPRGKWADLLAAAAGHVLSRGASSVLVVPDRRDLDQLSAALTAAGLNDVVVRTDAGQSGPERYAGYLRMLTPEPLIVIGNRSAVYAPVHAGLVVVWDDGDPLLREPLSPGVHARDAALLRQEQQGGALVFAGFSRSTDVERLVSVGWVHPLEAPRPRKPRVVLTPVREGEMAAARIPSAAFIAARNALEEGPVLVQVARPGYAPVLACQSCRMPARCGHCGGSLRAPERGAAPTCIACGRWARSWQCAHCEHTQLVRIGAGTVRTAEELGRAFAGVRVIVSDGDHRVEQVSTAPALVVATRGAEPVAAHGYRAVLLLDGERMLLADDLRIAEHCLRWWSNAAALAADGAPVHLVGIGGSLGRALATWTHSVFARAELVERAALRMPPAVRVAAVQGARPAIDTALESLRSDIPHLTATDVLGPVRTDDAWRALVRFDYHDGAVVTRALRAAVIADAVRARKGSSGRRPAARNTLRVRCDLPDLTLEGKA